MSIKSRKPNRRSIRLKGYDYSRPGFYFVTICCQDYQHLFGRVDHEKVQLNPIGEMVKTWWLDLESQFSCVALHEFVIMPNHLHGVLEIKKVDFGNNAENGSLGAIVGWFKSMSTNEYFRGVAERGWPFVRKRLWHRNYYERIIRSNEDYRNIIRYIQMNPVHWE